MAENMKLSRREQTAINYKKNGGNMKKAMIDAGYSESYADKNAQYLWGIIGDQIKEDQALIKDKEIKSIGEIQKWWSEKMDDEAEELKDRIRCSENLAKSLGAFVENVKVSGQINNPFANLTTEELKRLADEDG